jgi:hypothetical protein
MVSNRHKSDMIAAEWTAQTDYATISLIFGIRVKWSYSSPGWAQRLAAEHKQADGGVRGLGGQAGGWPSRGLAATRPAMSFLPIDAAAALSGLRLAWSSKHANISVPNPSQG